MGYTLRWKVTVEVQTISKKLAVPPVQLVCSNLNTRKFTPIFIEENVAQLCHHNWHVGLVYLGDLWTWVFYDAVRNSHLVQQP